MMFSICSKNDTSSNGKRKHLAPNVIAKKNEDDCPRYADGHKLSPYELYRLSIIEHNHSYLKKLGLDGSIILKKGSLCTKEKQNHEQQTGIKRMTALEMQGQDNFSFKESIMKRKSLCMICFYRFDSMIVQHLTFYSTNGLLLISLFPNISRKKMFLMVPL